MSLLSSRLVVWPLYATGTTVVALTASGIVWLAYLAIIKRLDPLTELPGTHIWAEQATPRDDLEEWARSKRNAPGDDTPLNLRIPAPYPFEGRLRLLTMDPQVISQILNGPEFVKPKVSRAFLNKLLGIGIFAAEGNDHKVLRKAHAPTFTKSVLHNMEPVMLSKAEQLCEIIAEEVAEAKGQPINILPPLNRAGVDVISTLGFGQDINSIANRDDPISKAYRRMLAAFEQEGSSSLGLFFGLNFSWWHTVFPDNMSRTWDEAHKEILKYGKMLLRLDEKQTGEDGLPAAPSLLHRIIRDAVDGGAMNMSDKNLVGAFSTFFFNGADSTGSTASWALHYLSLDQDLQRRLRAELSEMALGSSAAGRARALETLPILNAVICETLRFVPPLPVTIRMPTKDVIIRPSQDVVLRDGTVVREFEVKKGTPIHIPILGFNTLTDFWGPDAKEFNADRWKDVPETAKALPGIHQTMAFTFGPHGCPGWALALTEMRILVAAIIQNFEIHPCEEIVRAEVFMLRPYIKGKWKSGGVQLPLLLKPILP